PLCPFALHPGGEGGHREEALVRGRVGRPLPAVEVVEDADVGIEDLLDDIGRLDLLPSEPAFLTRDEHLERRPGPEHVQEPGQARPLLKLRPTDPIVHKYVLVPHDPPAREGPCPRMLDLPGHRSLLIRDAGLFRRLPGVEGDHHRAGWYLQAGRLPTLPRAHEEGPPWPGASARAPRSRSKASANASITAARTGTGPRGR